MTKVRMVPAILFAAALSCSFASHAQTATPQQVLQRYVSDLQRSPDDTALREKIIRHVGTMTKAPAIPEEARRHFIEGNALLKAAKDQKGYELAIDAYHKCLLIAPWWPEANYNFAVALELANRLDSSVNALKLYIATNPGAEEARKAQDKIYEIGAKKIIAAREREESSPQAVAAREQNETRAQQEAAEKKKNSEDWLSKIDGARYTRPDAATLAIIDIKGTVAILGAIYPENYPDPRYRGYKEFRRFEIQGRKTVIPINGPAAQWWKDDIYIISEGGDRIIEQWTDLDGKQPDSRKYIYLRQR